MQEQHIIGIQDQDDKDIMIFESLPDGIIKYDFKYQSIVPDFSAKFLSKENLDPEKKAAVDKNFPFTRV